jgi:hypothetical protein
MGSRRVSTHHCQYHARRPDSSADPPSHYVPELFKTIVTVVVAAERALDGPEDLAHETTA